MRRTPLHYLRLIALWAMLLPFAAVSLVASGVMPARAANGAIILVICTGGGGMVEMAFDPVTMQPIDDSADDGTSSDQAHCYWAAAQAPFDAPETVQISLPRKPAPTQAHFIASTTLSAAASTGLPPSTGPPATA
ncbi:hypothetical protein BVG79_00163 [Ketogulonicigenium robustum]|uniref:Uncharacterized protein n=1 Tax=Ketogulonicigenium robustum TaxID=92947 RepID=A0A1W6NWK6_9RHOB|nr:hypothetical protein [Ketogulonicigenium robustum]ARO13523.1 hypothetical protein BVG79_00163 [Ketogulonicigenium robustum]